MDDQLAKMAASVARIDERTECLPDLVKTVSRHDESIKNLKTTESRSWGLFVGVILTALTSIGALITAAIAYINH